MMADLQETAPLLRHGGKQRRRKMAVSSRLGNGGRRRRWFAAGRALRLRWVAALYRRAVRRLRPSCAAAFRDVVEGAAVVGAARLDGEF